MGLDRKLQNYKVYDMRKSPARMYYDTVIEDIIVLSEDWSPEEYKVRGSKAERSRRVLINDMPVSARV